MYATDVINRHKQRHHNIAKILLMNLNIRLWWPLEDNKILACHSMHDTQRFGWRTIQRIIGTSEVCYAGGACECILQGKFRDWYVGSVSFLVRYVVCVARHMPRNGSSFFHTGNREVQMKCCTDVNNEHEWLCDHLNAYIYIYIYDTVLKCSQH